MGTIRQFGPTQRATLSTQRTTVKWLLLLGLVTLAVAKPNPTIERMKRASVQMHTYRRLPLVSKAEAAARRRLVHNVSGKKNLKGDMWDFETTEEFGGLYEERQSQKLRPGWTESKNRNGRSVYKHKTLSPRFKRPITGTIWYVHGQHKYEITRKNANDKSRWHVIKLDIEARTRTPLNPPVELEEAFLPAKGKSFTFLKHGKEKTEVKVETELKIPAKVPPKLFKQLCINCRQISCVC